MYVDWGLYTMKLLYLQESRIRSGYTLQIIRALRVFLWGWGIKIKQRKSRVLRFSLWTLVNKWKSYLFFLLLLPEEVSPSCIDIISSSSRSLLSSFSSSPSNDSPSEFNWENKAYDKEVNPLNGRINESDLFSTGHAFRVHRHLSYQFSVWSTCCFRFRILH